MVNRFAVRSVPTLVIMKHDKIFKQAMGARLKPAILAMISGRAGMVFFVCFKQPDINQGVTDYHNVPNAILLDVCTLQEYREGAYSQKSECSTAGH